MRQMYAHVVEVVAKEMEVVRKSRKSQVCDRVGVVGREDKVVADGWKPKCDQYVGGKGKGPSKVGMDVLCRMIM